MTAATVYLIRTGAAWVYGLTSFVVGVAATAAGAGTGLPHLGKAGWSAVTLAGLTALGAGVVLLVAGAGTTVHRTHRWWRLLVAPAVLAVVYVSLWSGIQAVAATNVPRTAVVPATPADRGLAYQTVYCCSTRAYGRSSGRAMDFGWSGDRDVAGAVSFLQSRADVDSGRIGAVGMSMGGEEAIGAATNPGVRAVVAEGATNRTAADKAFLPGVYDDSGWIQQRIDVLTTACTDRLTDARPPITLRAASAATPRPMLLITAGNVPDEAHAARHIQRGNANVQVWEVPGTGHAEALSTHPEEWGQRVTGFLASALLSAGKVPVR